MSGMSIENMIRITSNDYLNWIINFFEKNKLTYMEDQIDFYNFDLTADDARNIKSLSVLYRMVLRYYITKELDIKNIENDNTVKSSMYLNLLDNNYSLEISYIKIPGNLKVGLKKVTYTENAVSINELRTFYKDLIERLVSLELKRQLNLLESIGINKEEFLSKL